MRKIGPTLATPHPERVLIAAPYGRDGELLAQVLNRGEIDAHVCGNVDSLVEALKAGAGAALVADEALNSTNIPILAKTLSEQPAWSDFPLLVLTGGGEVTAASSFRLNLLAPLGNVTLIERPIRTSTLLSSVRTALRARRHQYQIQDRMELERTLTETLRESEAKLKFALDAAQLGAWELRMPQRELSCSPQCLRNFGMRPDAPLSEPEFIAILHPADRDRVLQSMRQAFEVGTTFSEEFRILNSDGRRRWVWSAGRPVYVDRVPVRMVGVTLDITVRKQAEEAVRESETQLRTLADSMPQLAWMANSDGHIFWYNRRWYEYTGTNFSEMAGWGWQRVHHPDNLPAVVANWKAALETGTPVEMEFPIRSSTGEFRWFLTQTRPIRNARGEVVRWFGTNTDVDDKRQAEKALRESEELARSVIQNSPDCVEVLDVHGKTLLVNSAGCRVMGAHPEEMAQANWIESWRPEDRAQAARALEAALHGRPLTFQDSCRTGWSGPEAAADRRWEVTVTPIANDDGQVSKILCVSRDITQRLRAEAELRQTAKLESLGVMAGGIAHDFNNLLTGILGNASLLAELPNPADRELAEDIVHASERAADLTRQMLAYSGKGRFEVRAIDLSAQVREILRLVKPMIHKDVSIELNLAEQLPHVQADPGQMQQLIMNLVINGAEAMEGQAGRVIITTSTIEIDDIFITQILTGNELVPGKYIYLEIQDTGCGMNEETKAKIFDPFFTTKFTGRGLGLAAVSGIVRGHKGALRVYSFLRAGTTFKVFLPAIEGAEAPVVKASDPRDEQVSGTILLVDDEEIVRRIGRASLERKGYSVILAGSGGEALELFESRAREIDLVILDMTMPMMGGEETLSLLRDVRPDIPVIVCSGYNEVEVIRRFTQQGIAGFIQKPYTATSLTQTARSVLDAKYGAPKTLHR